MITVRRASGLAVPFEPPEVTAEAAAERSWEVRPYGLLLEPKRPEFLPTTPYSPFPCSCSVHPWGYYPLMWPWSESPGLSAALAGLVP